MSLGKITIVPAFALLTAGFIYSNLTYTPEAPQKPEPRWTEKDAIAQNNRELPTVWEKTATATATETSQPANELGQHINPPVIKTEDRAEYVNNQPTL